MTQRLTRALLLTAVRSAAWVAPRDAHSCDALTAMGVPTSRGQVVPDLTYLNPAVRLLDHRSGRPAVGVGVIDWRGAESDRRHADTLRQQYVDTMSDFIRKLTSSGYEVRILTGDTGDEETAMELVRRVPRARHTPAFTTSDLVGQLSAVDIVVASRYHNVLLALAMGIPTISVGYGTKHTDLMSAHGVPEYALSIRNVTVAQLETRLAALVRERADAGLRISEAAGNIRSALEGRLAELDAVLASPGRRRNDEDP